MEDASEALVARSLQLIAILYRIKDKNFPKSIELMNEAIARAKGSDLEMIVNLGDTYLDFAFSTTDAKLKEDSLMKAITTYTTAISRSPKRSDWFNTIAVAYDALFAITNDVNHSEKRDAHRERAKQIRQGLLL